MNNPFVFEKPVEDENFTGREWILARVKEQLLSIQNVILLSPRGWGKTSLSKEVSYRIWRYHESYRTCFVNIKPGMTEKEFGDALICQIWQVPGINTIVNLNDYPNDTELFNQVEAFAVLNHIKLIICISGIHNILNLHKPSVLLTRLSKTWRSHTNCAYLLMGNVKVSGIKNKMQIDPQARKIGNTYYLERFNHKDSTAFIAQKFHQSKRQICDQAVQLISQFTNQIPYFLQLLAWHTWVYAEKRCTVEVVEEAINIITGQYRILFQSNTENFTDNQRKFVQWLALDGYQPYSRENISSNRLNSAGHVVRAYKSLLNKEIIFDHQGEIMFSNPFYKHWLNKHYFK